MDGITRISGFTRTDRITNKGGHRHGWGTRISGVTGMGIGQDNR